MKFFLVVIQFLCTSFLWASENPWDFKISAGDQFRNSQRSVYLEYSEYKNASMKNIHTVMIIFDIKNKDTNTKIASLLAHYYGTQDSSISFGIVGELIKNDQIDESIQTAMGIFRAQKRSNLLFDRFLLGVIGFNEPDGLLSFCHEKFTFFKSSECTPTQFLRLLTEDSIINF